MLTVRNVGELQKVMKLSMTTYFARMQQLDEFPMPQRSSPFKRYHKMDLHHVDKLPLSMQDYIEKEIKVLRNYMPTCIEE